MAEQEGVESMLVVDPPDTVGPLKVGMGYTDAIRVLAEIDGHLRPAPGSRTPSSFADYENGMSIAVHSQADRVVAIEVYKPTEAPETVVLFGIPVFALSAERVTRLLSARARVLVEENGARIVAPDLLVALWMSSYEVTGVPLAISPDLTAAAGEQSFESILIAHPGYYDGPDGHSSL